MKEWQGEPSQGCLAVQMQLFLVNKGFALLIFPPYFYVCRYVVCLFVFILHVTKDAERGCQCHHIGLISPALGIAIFSSPPPGKTLVHTRHGEMVQWFRALASLFQCSSRELEFSSQRPLQSADNYLQLYFQRIPCCLLVWRAPTYIWKVWVHAHIHRHTSLIVDINLKNNKFLAEKLTEWEGMLYISPW